VVATAADAGTGAATMGTKANNRTSRARRGVVIALT